MTINAMRKLDTALLPWVHDELLKRGVRPEIAASFAIVGVELNLRSGTSPDQARALFDAVVTNVPGFVAYFYEPDRYPGIVLIGRSEAACDKLVQAIKLHFGIWN